MLRRTSYDSAGNLTAQTLDGEAQSYTWDPLGSLQFLVTPEITKGYLYTPSGQRLVEFDWSEGWKETWSLRDLEGQVVRQWRNTVDGDDSWTWQKDYIRRNGQLLASITPDEERHYHLDHLGTPRLVTSDLGLEQARHTYFPFGQEATDPAQTTEPMRFTGHERDTNGTGTADDLDYLHARYCSPNQGRFLSVDKVLGKPANPQSWFHAATDSTAFATWRGSGWSPAAALRCSKTTSPPSAITKTPPCCHASPWTRFCRKPFLKARKALPISAGLRVAPIDRLSPAER